MLPLYFHVLKGVDTHKKKVKMFCVAFSGVPGVGKTTLLKRLQETRMLNPLLEDICNVGYVFEASDLWRTKGWLQTYYADPDNNAFRFQLQAFVSHVNQVRAEAKKTYARSDLPTVLFMERSMYDQLLFWQMQIHMGYKSALDKDNQELYMEIWTKWFNLIPPVELVFFCDTHNVQQSMKRIYNREGGTTDDAGTVQCAGGIKLDYQTKLHDLHLKTYTSPVARITDSFQVYCEHLSTDVAYNTDDEALASIAISIATSVEMTLKKKTEDEKQ